MRRWPLRYALLIFYRHRHANSVTQVKCLRDVRYNRGVALLRQFRGRVCSFDGCDEAGATWPFSSSDFMIT
jgi:hypothetical protein